MKIGAGSEILVMKLLELLQQVPEDMLAEPDLQLPVLVIEGDRKVRLTIADAREVIQTAKKARL